MDKIHSRIDQLAAEQVSGADVAEIRGALVQLAKKPTYQTWEDVHGSFPRVDNLFAAYLVTKGNVSTGEQVLTQKGFDYRELSTGRTIRALFWGKTTNTANVKTIRIRILEGAHNTIIAAFAPQVSETGHWVLALRLMRTTDVLLRATVFLSAGPANLAATRTMQNVTQPTAMLINPLYIQVTGEGTADSDVTLEGGIIPRIETNVETFQSTVGNITTGEDTLAEKILRTGELTSNGFYLRGIYWGKCANNANAKTLRLRIIEGANNSILVSASLTVSETGHWVLGFQMMRTGTASLRAVGQITDGAANTQLSISSINVSQITATLANAVTIRLTGDATSTDDITVEGGVIPSSENIISSVQATVGNVGAGEDVLAETILGASGVQNNIDVDGRSIRGIYWGHTTNNANTKTLRARVIEGANDNILVSCSLSVSETGSWCLAFELTRLSAVALLSVAQAVGGPANGSATASGNDVTQPVATLANAVTIRITGQATADNDITIEGGSLSFQP